MLSRQFISYHGMLYKRMPIGVHLRCVDKGEAQKLMEVVHKGVCGAHMNGTILAKKITRQGYFWLTMEMDCVKNVIISKNMAMLVIYLLWNFKG